MTLPLPTPEATVIVPRPPVASEEELAEVLDEVLDALQAGRPVQRDVLLARYPQLAEPLDALLRLRPPVADHSPLPPTTRIGPYVLEGELGTGGFGTVYQAHDPDVKRHVALKLLHPGRLAEPEAVQRFQREACVTAQLAHPGIVRLLDYSRTGPPHYLVTELISGVDPCRWCRDGGADLFAVVELVVRIAEAVDHAHQQGVCHRDLKPANILIDSTGAPHILDFGLARVLSAEDSLRPTLDGCILGSLAYMPPEQAAGDSQHADARSDVYSLGVILYELMTEQLPFQGPAHLLPTRVLEEEPARPRSIKTAIPEQLEAICLKALAKRPEQRYQSAGELARDLQKWQAHEPTVAQPHNWWSRLNLVLGRRHRDTMPQGWTRLLFLLGLTIFAGCASANYWELKYAAASVPLILATKAAQVAVMVFLVFRFRPLQAPRLTPAERQIWTLVPAYYSSFVALVLLNVVFDTKIPLAPVLALLSGMGFMSLGATIWGWFYVWGAGFYALAVLIALFPALGLTILGAGWCVALVVGAVLLRRTS